MKLAFDKRKMRKRQHQVEALGMQAESLAERHFFKRLDRLVPVRRFVVTWLLLFVLICGCLVGQIRALDGHFRSLQPIPGGIYTEGILGDFTTSNPLYATGKVDETVSKLLFAGLLTYDADNNLVGGLAEGWTVDELERVYTVKLKPGLVWHDGAPLTARDVVFTYKTIQNPDALSILNQSWKDIQVAAVDDMTVTFTLPNQLSAFPHHMTNGIVPEHILKDIPPAELRAATFNTLSPVGAGPFKWQKIEISGETPETREEQIALAPFEAYYAGAPKLSNFVVHSFHDANRLAQSFERREVSGASFLELPVETRTNEGIVTNDFMLTAANMVFFKLSMPVFADVAVRRALVQGADVPAIIDALDYTTRPVKGPFLQNQLGYDRTLVQSGYDPAAATAALDAAGWVPGANGIRAKGATPLSFTVQAQDTPENRIVTAKLQDDWRRIGVRADMQLRDSSDLQQAIAQQDYEALLYGISIGTDPDVFVYWHSSQKDARSNRLNFSQYGSKVADAALEGGRTRADASLRSVKYKPFLQAWQQDTPALGLYQPRYMYATHGTVYGLDPRTINTDTDHLNNVHLWQIRQASLPTR
jgi:peptide/nickel transport system substrate-binding protein